MSSFWLYSSMFASSVVSSGGRSCHAQSLILGYHAKLVSGIGKLQTPAQKRELKSGCAGFVYNKLYVQNICNRKQVKLRYRTYSL